MYGFNMTKDNGTSGSTYQSYLEKNQMMVMGRGESKTRNHTRKTDQNSLFKCPTCIRIWQYPLQGCTMIDYYGLHVGYDKERVCPQCENKQ